MRKFLHRQQAYIAVNSILPASDSLPMDSVNHTTPPLARPIDLPDTMKYDSHNRLSEYIVTEDRKVRLLYDPMGRVFRKEIYEWVSENWEFSKAIHYYYQGGNLVQEYEVTVLNPTTAQADIEWDYLRGRGGRVLRRRETDGETVTDTLHIDSAIGTTMQEASPDVSGDHVGTTNGYVTNADGEPFWVDYMQPTDENHIQYHGGFLEDKEFHTSVANQERGYFYRMGIRHYSPMLGRFLQKDPFTIARTPNAQFPLNVNPYQYAYNRPLQYADTNGYQPVLCPECLSGWGAGGSGDGGSGGSFSKNPFQNLGGSGNENGGGSDADERVCRIPYPEECGCGPCCAYDDEPVWASGGCCGTWLWFICDFDEKESPEWCACACCVAEGGDQHAPNAYDCMGYG